MNDSPAHAPRSFLTRLARFVLIAAAAFLLMCGVAAVAVPLLIGQVVLPRASESIGRQITAERVRFNPFTLILTARGIRVGDGATPADFVTVQDVVADLSLSSIRHLAPVIESLKVTAPAIDLYRRDDGSFSFGDIVERLKRPTAETAGEPMRFALRDLEVRDAEIRLDDRLLQQKHTISNMQVVVPLLSNLEDGAGGSVHPSVSALVNGSAFRLTGVSMPFSESGETTLDATLQDLDISTYLPLAPVELAVVVPKGRLSTELKLQFARQAGVGVLGISGTADVTDLQIDAKAGGRLVSADRIRLGVDRVEPLSGRYALGELGVDGLDVEVERRPDGSLALVDALTPRQTRRASLPSKVPAEKAAEQKPAEQKPAADQQAADRARTPADADAEDIRWSLRSTKLEGGRIGYRDRAVSPAVQLIHTAVALELGEIGSRQAQPASGKLSLKQNESSSLSWAGQVDVANSRADGRLNAKVAALAPYVPYLAGAVNAGVQSGALAAEGDVKLGWARDLTVEVANAQASVDNARLTLPDEVKPAVVIGRIAAHGIAASLAGRLAEVARLELSGGNIRVERAADGKLNLQRFSTQSPPNDGAVREDKPSPGWTVRVARVDLDRNAIDWRDLSAPQPVNLPVGNLSGTIEQVGTDLSRSAKVDLKARLGESGEVTARGDLALSPLSTQLDVRLQRLGLAAFDPYVSQKLALGIDQGALSTGGKLVFDKDRLRYQGRVQVDGLRSRERTTSAQAIRWKSLVLEDIDVDIDPSVLGPGDRILVGGITLDEFFARVVLNEQGRFNLQDIVVTEASTQAQVRAAEQAQARADKADGSDGPKDTAAPAAAADEGSPPAPAAPRDRSRSETRGGGRTGGEGRNSDEGTGVATTGSGAAGRPAGESGSGSSPAAAKSAANGPTVRVGIIKLQRGSSNFTDRFVQPNYSVNLTELDGSLSAMASDDPKPADLALTGRVDGNAPIDISGKINPFGPTLYTDVHAVAKGIDLPTLTPYSVKYAGYAIEKGKLSLDVHYTIENEQLRAENSLFLDQLTLGDKVESPGATSLPIQFALGLLKNSKGEINVSLPVSGSLDDPQFSIGGVIGRAVLNLLSRVITSPFTALAAAFGGSGAGAEELSFVEFRPGTSTLTDEAVRRLQALSKALTERPALKLEIAGRVDPKSERDAIERQRLDARLKALKRRQSGGGEAPAQQDRDDARTENEAPPQPGAQGAKDQQDRQAQVRQARANQEDAAVAAGVTLSREEYPVLLKLLYDEAKAGDRPPAAAGAAPPLAVADMEKVLLDSINVDAEAIRRLATRRSQAARRWLATQGRIPEDRMFMLAPRISADATGPNQTKPQCSANCAEFSLR